jgi:hypothetical protein
MIWDIFDSAIIQAIMDDSSVALYVEEWFLFGLHCISSVLQTMLLFEEDGRV